MSDRETLVKIRSIMRRLLFVDMDGLGPVPRKGTTKREAYRALFEIQELLEIRKRPCEHSPRTKADCFRSMSDEQLAELFSNGNCGYCKIRDYCFARKLVDPCEVTWLRFLREEVTVE